MPAQVISEQELIAAVLVAEAGGEGLTGMQAVKEVIWERTRHHRISFWEVLTARKQFSCLNRVSPGQLIVKSRGHPRWGEALALANYHPVTRLTAGATHYCRVDVHPKWSRNRQPVAVIGNHKFYKL